ncbi:MAG: RNA 2',3'-cyclic phosphodiesterase [Chloroflexi bacterium]|nr:RNA 2',3'-cyclic phosphodiesterase [Chloroflexota bacterium]
MADLIRSFIAIELDDAIRRALGDVPAKLKAERAAKSVRWTAPESIHITLKFLGDVDAGRLPALQNAIAEASKGIPPFALTLRGIGAFPNTRRPNIVWVGAEGQVEIATELAQKIEDACAALGFAREDRLFTPHLTIGRVKRDASPNDRRFIGEMIDRAQVGMLGELHVDHVSLMKSELRPTGSVYTRLSVVQLVNM